MNTRLNPSYESNEVSCPVIDDPATIDEGYDSYRFDESKVEPVRPARIFFPESTAQLAAAIRSAVGSGSGGDVAGRITVSGARTGIVGGAAAGAGNIIVTERIKGVELIEVADHRPHLRCGAGTTLGEIRDYLADTGYRYPVDPTEMSASIGGTIATNASGARTLRFGPTRKWIRSLTVVLADGGILDISRGALVSSDGAFDLTRGDGNRTTFVVDPVRIPATKHNAGYYLTRPADPIDLFIGSEGTLGVVTETVLDLLPVPATTLGLTLFLPTDDPAPLVRALLELQPTALEYMDEHSLALLREARERGVDGGTIPPLPPEARAALYIELDLPSEDALESSYERIESLCAKFDIDADSSWAGFDESEIAGMKRFRHALPERINALIAERKRTIPELTKIGTDMAVPIDRLDEMLGLYRATLSAAGLDFYIFGHIGDGHVHVNVVPETPDEWRLGYRLYREFAAVAVKLGGSVAAEHGIGRLKRSFLGVQFSHDEIETMRTIKGALDPDGVLNPGVLFEGEPASRRDSTAESLETTISTDSAPRATAPTRETPRTTNDRPTGRG